MTQFKVHRVYIPHTALQIRPPIHQLPLQTTRLTSDVESHFGTATEHRSGRGGGDKLKTFYTISLGKSRKLG